MNNRAFFGKPQSGFVEGGTHITVYLVPVLDGRLVVFDVHATQARGRWLPWDVLDFGGNPYETASRLVDDWCQGSLTRLELADVMSFRVPAGGWELAIVFRAQLTALPEADDARTPYAFEAGRYDAIGNFDPVDLERWVGTPAAPPAPDPAPRTDTPRDGDELIF